MAGMPRRARHAMAAPSAQKSFLPEASSCAIMPAAAIIEAAVVELLGLHILELLLG